VAEGGRGEDGEMRVIHVVPTITEEAAGPSYTVPRVCELLMGVGADVQLASLDWAVMPSRLPYLKTFPLGFGPRRLGVSPRMRRWLKQEVTSNRVEIIHNHSLWMMPNIYPGYAVRNSRCLLVVSPHGTLSAHALGLNALQKKVFWHALQAPVLRVAACFQATAESEYEDIRRLGFRQPVCIIPNGIDVPPLEKTPNSERRQLLFLGRIHPKKGVDILLHAWQIVEHQFPDWDLHIVGPDNGGYLTEMQALAVQLGLKRVVFRGPLFGEEKLRAYQVADLFVLPTHSENFGMTVAEALAAGTPVIVTKGAPWNGLEKQRAGWWIDIGVDPLVACLEQALTTSPEHLAEMGRAGREWMLRDYSWERIGEQLSAVYRWLLEGGEMPPCVRLD
jgi:glycosyltransferase involved in cell wall biosynthesis